MKNDKWKMENENTSKALLGRLKSKFWISR
jgi:hypothetical protein